jgi:hypothetical protein
LLHFSQKIAQATVQQQTAALRDFAPPYDRSGSWSCENSSARRTRRSISEQLHISESNHTAHAAFDALLKNCFFYISRMYEFLHGQGHFQPIQPDLPAG